MTSNKTPEEYTVTVYVTPAEPFVKAVDRICAITLIDNTQTLLWKKTVNVDEDVNATSVALALLAEALPALAPKITNTDATLTFEVYTESIYSILKDGYVNRRYREEIKTLMGSAVNVIANRDIRVKMLQDEPDALSPEALTALQNPAPETKSLVDVLIEDFSNELQN